MNRIKVNGWIRALQFLFVAVLMSCVCLLAVACNHEHAYVQEVTKEPTCTEVGQITYRCTECNDSYTEELPITDHNYSYVSKDGQHWQVCADCTVTTMPEAHNYNTVQSSTPATCYSTGIAIKACVCGDTITETLEMTAHSFTVSEKNADKHWLKCANCPATSGEETHKFGSPEIILVSTCTKQGSQKLSCACGATQTESLPLAEHSYTKIASDNVYHWTVCAVCDNEKPSQTKTPHNLTETILDADCVKKGSKTTACADCNYMITEEIDALGHDLDKSEFSSAATGSGHYYKCSRCSKDIAEPHQFVNCDCPEQDVGNRAPTCYRAGHQAEKCEICNKVYCRQVPKTDDHNLDTSVWLHNGTYHWHTCTNGDDEYTCDYQGDKAQHEWFEQIVPATCTESGTRKMVCECGEVQSTKVIPALGHDYTSIQTLIEATCSSEGKVLQRCENCGTETEKNVPKTNHELFYVSTINGHRKKCANCDYIQSESNHTWIENVVSEATCTSSGLTIRTCKFCEFTYEQTTTKDHSYVTDPNSIIDATCKDYATHEGTCSQCGDTKVFVDEYLGYADHVVKYYPEKAMTETEPGNKPYWQCKVCNRYFSGHGCAIEWFEEDIFTYPVKIVSVDNLAKLTEIAETMQSGDISDDYYLLALTVDEAYGETNTLMVSDSNGMTVWATLIERENVSSINSGSSIVLKGNLLKSNDDISLVNCRVVSIDCGDDELLSLYFTVTDLGNSGTYLNIFAYDRALDEWYYPNTNNYNCIVAGSKLQFSNNIYNAVLQKVIINGKSYTMTNRTLEITVEEDIHAEFVFDDDNYCSVTLREIDASNNNGDAITADAYISYTYTNGGYNDLGHILKNSRLTFTAENANITGINITYDIDWIDRENNSKALENTINVIRENGLKVKYEQGDISGRGQVKITIPVSEACTVLEYFADVHQAQVTEIIILYQTYNS